MTVSAVTEGAKKKAPITAHKPCATIDHHMKIRGALAIRVRE